MISNGETMVQNKKTLWLLVIVSFNGLGVSQACADHTSEHSIAQRLAPVGKVRVATTAPSTATAGTASTSVMENSGKNRYEASCAVCHASGVAGAPTLGDKAGWKPRITKGLDTLVKNAMIGLNAMPPKGTCMTCSDEEIRKTVEYMVNQSK